MGRIAKVLALLARLVLVMINVGLSDDAVVAPFTQLALGTGKRGVDVLLVSGFSSPNNVIRLRLSRALLMLAGL